MTPPVWIQRSFNMQLSPDQWLVELHPEDVNSVLDHAEFNCDDAETAELARELGCFLLSQMREFRRHHDQAVVNAMGF